MDTSAHERIITLARSILRGNPSATHLGTQLMSCAFLSVSSFPMFYLCFFCYFLVYHVLNMKAIESRPSLSRISW